MIKIWDQGSGAWRKMEVDIMEHMFYNERKAVSGGESMHFVKAKSILSAGNGMNLYRGCQHGCVYCDARSKCYQMDHAFEDIAVKENAIELLEGALRSKRRPCMIAPGP